MKEKGEKLVLDAHRYFSTKLAYYPIISLDFFVSLQSHSGGNKIVQKTWQAKAIRKVALFPSNYIRKT
jgi:hypothetical protein